MISPSGYFVTLLQRFSVSVDFIEVRARLGAAC
jgi:hypothetical protein